LKPERREQLEPATRLSAGIILNTRLHVGHLAFDAAEIDLQDLFAPHGPVADVKRLQARVRGKSRGSLT